MSIPQKWPDPPLLPPVEDLVRDLVADPERWLDTANDQLGGEKPRDLVGTVKEPVLRDLLDSIKHGSFS